MGRPQAYDTRTDVCEEVSQEAYLAGRRAMPHLFDLVPPFDLRVAGSDVDIAALSTIVRTAAEDQSDVRLLVGGPDPTAVHSDGYVTLARRLANELRCDVYLPPPDARVRYLRESSSVAGESWDAVVVHAGTGEPTPWLLIRPDERADAVPAWFISTAGRLRQNNGLITVPLPHGLAFATAATFRETATLAQRVTASPGAVTALAVAADLGRFEISRFNEASALLNGVEFATLVAASLDLIHPDVQVALTWPADQEARAVLDVELMRFADALDRTVWAPRPGGSAATLANQFAAVDDRGRPATWHAYPSRLATTWQPGYGTDADGRLAPITTVPPAAPASASASALAGPVRAVAAVAAEARQQPAVDPIVEAVLRAEHAAARPVFMPASPTVLMATLGPAPTHPVGGHCVSWLPPSVVVNRDGLDLVVWLPPAAAHAGSWEVSSPDLFLLAGPDPDEMAERDVAERDVVGGGRAGRLLRLRAPAGTAVDLAEHLDLAPPEVARRARDTDSTYLLPLSWLPSCQLTGLFDVDGQGSRTERELVRASVDVQFDGAEHGIPGLPNDVVSWPAEAEWAGTPSYLVLPDLTNRNGQSIHSGFAALSRSMPALEVGTRVLEIRVRRRRAIDVPATLKRLAGLPMISRLRDLDDFDLLLSEQDFSRAVVSKIWRYGPDGEPVVDKLGGDTLSDVLSGSA